MSKGFVLLDQVPNGRWRLEWAEPDSRTVAVMYFEAEDEAQAIEAHARLTAEMNMAYPPDEEERDDDGVEELPSRDGDLLRGAGAGEPGALGAP